MVAEERFTHLHLSCSSAILYQLSPSTTIHSVLPVQFTCLTVFSKVLFDFYLLVWNPPLYTPYISSLSHCLPFAIHVHTRCHRKLFCCSPEIISSILVSLLSTYLQFYRHTSHPSDHSHFCPLECHLIFTAWRVRPAVQTNSSSVFTQACRTSSGATN